MFGASSTILIQFEYLMLKTNGEEDMIHKGAIYKF